MVTVKFLERRGKNFGWPAKTDTQILNFKEVLCELESPRSVSKTRKDLYFIPNEESINKLFDSIVSR